MKKENIEYLSMRECAEALGVSKMTIYRWYRWYDSPLNCTTLELPKIYRFKTHGKNEEKFIKKSDLPVLLTFKKKLRQGMMADYNAACSWGKYGEELISKRDEDKKQIKSVVENKKNSI